MFSSTKTVGDGDIQPLLVMLTELNAPSIMVSINSSITVT